MLASWPRFSAPARDSRRPCSAGARLSSPGPLGLWLAGGAGGVLWLIAGSTYQPRSDDRLAAGDGDGGAGNVARLVARQQHVGRRHFAGLSRPLHGNLLAEMRDLLLRHGRR